MDAVVLGLDQSVSARVAFLQDLEMGLLITTLVVLTLEAVLIFRPAVRHLEVSLAQLELRGQQATRRLESLRHLAGGIAHSFNNILTGIMGHAHLQRLDALASRQSTEFIDAQLEGGRRAAEIVSRLLLYSGHGKFDLQPTPLGPWLCDLMKMITPPGSPVEVRVEVIEDSTAAVDRKAIRQAVKGLVANAVEAMAGRSGAVEVRLLHVLLSEPRAMSGPYRTELPPGLYACIQVTDQGEGIEAEELDHIFDPFHTRKEFGRGLGLAAILGIAHGHGGGIELESQPGRGSTVSLYLPIIEVSGTEQTARISTPA
jgi:signal transduction histidine kinase